MYFYWIHRLTFLSILLFSSVVDGVSLRGPPVVLPNELKPLQIVQLGQEFRITCPIEGDPNPIIDWYKDGESITPAWSPRFRINSKILRIRSVYSEDAGIYECKGVNGFGSQIARTRLIVSDEEMIGGNEKFYSSNNNNERRRVVESVKNTVNIINSTPKFTAETTEQTGPMHVSYGITIRLRCEAKGTPTPKINWLKNGKSVGDKLWKWSSWTLILNKLTVEDSGTYTCIANSTSGKIELHIQLFVTEIVEKKRPELATGGTNNTTVAVGNEAILECVVRASMSTLPPHIKWLKRVPDEDYYLKGSIRGRHKHRLLPTDNHHVLVIQETQDKGIRIIESQRNGTFISKLIIAKSDLSHSGSYICLATNSAGYSFKEIAILTVHSGPSLMKDAPTTSPSSQTVSFPALVIGISLAVTLLMVGGACILRKYQERRQSKQLSKSITPKKLSSTSSNSSSCTIPPILVSNNSTSPSKYQHLHHHRHHSSNRKDGHDCHQLLVSTTSTHSSSSSSGTGHHHHHHHRQDLNDGGGINQLICNPNHPPHYRSTKLVSNDPVIEMAMSRCTCFDQDSEEIDDSNLSSIRPSEQQCSNIPNNIMGGSTSHHSSYCGRWR